MTPPRCQFTSGSRVFVASSPFPLADDVTASYRHVLSQLRDGNLAAAQKMASQLSTSTGRPFFLELSALINHMIATEELLAGSMPLMGQEGVTASDIAGTRGGMILSIAEAQLKKAMPTEVMKLDAHGAALTPSDIDAGAVVASTLPLPATNAATMLAVHTYRRLGRYQDALDVLDEMSSRHKAVIAASALTARKRMAEATKQIAEEAAKLKAEKLAGQAAETETDSGKAAEAMAVTTASGAGEGVAASDAGAEAKADAEEAASAATATITEGDAAEDPATRRIEDAARYARQRQLPISKRRGEAIDLRCAMGDWAGAYTEAVHQLRERPGDVYIMSAAMHCCLQLLNIRAGDAAAAASAAAGASNAPGLAALCTPVEADPATVRTDAEAEAAACETESSFIRDAISRQLFSNDASQRRSIRVQLTGGMQNPSRREVASLRTALELGDKILGVESSAVPPPSVAHFRGLLRAGQRASVEAVTDFEEEAIAYANQMAVAMEKIRAEAAKAASEAAAATAGDDTDADTASVAASATAASAAGAASGVVASDAGSAPAAAAATSGKVEAGDEGKSLSTGGRVELAALLIEADLEMRLLDATGGVTGTGGALPEGATTGPGGAAIAALAEAGDPAALLVALLGRTVTRFGSVVMIVRESRRLLEPFVAASDVGLDEGAIPEDERVAAAQPRWRDRAVPRHVVTVAGDHVRASPAVSIFGETSPYNWGESPLKRGLRSPAFRASKAACDALAACFAEAVELARPTPEERAVLEGTFEAAFVRFQAKQQVYMAIKAEFKAAHDRGDAQEVERLGNVLNSSQPQVSLVPGETGLVRAIEAKASRFQTASRMLRCLGPLAPCRLGLEGLVAHVAELAAAFKNVEQLQRLAAPADETPAEEGTADLLLLHLARAVADVSLLRWTECLRARNEGDEARAAAMERGSWQALMDAIILIETRVSHGVPGQVGLLLMQLYSRAGAMAPIQRVFQALGMRSLSLDSASYLLLPHALRLGGYTEARELCRAIVEVHNENQRVVPGRMAAAASRSNNAAALDFVMFRHRMEHSLQRSEAQSVIGIISVPSDKLAGTKDWLKDKVGASGTGVGSDPNFFCSMAKHNTTSLCTDNIDYEVALELDPPAASLSSIGKRVLAMRSRDRALQSIETRRLLMLALHAVAHARTEPLAAILPAVKAALAAINRLPVAGALPAADVPAALSPLMVEAPEGTPVLPAEGEGISGAGMRHIGTHAVPKHTIHGIWGAAFVALEAADAVFRAFPVHASTAAAAPRGAAARGSSAPGEVDLAAAEHAATLLKTLGASAEALVDAIIGDPLLPAETDASGAAAASSGAGTATADLDLTKAASWKGRVVRARFVVATASLIGEAMAVIPVCFGSMAAYVPAVESKPGKGKLGKGKRVRAKGGKGAKTSTTASPTPEDTAAKNVVVALSDAAFKLSRALDRLSKVLGAGRSGLAPPVATATVKASQISSVKLESKADSWSFAESCIPDLLVDKDADVAASQAAAAMVLATVREAWVESLGRMQDTLRDRLAMLKDASVL